MQLIFCVLIFLMGIFCGSFFTLAIHRLPLGQDITHTRSYCPNCNHRLEFLDLFPIFSYIFLGGKCRYCREKINPKYLIIETISGLIFVAFWLSINLDIINIDMDKLVYLAVGLMYISSLLIIYGINLKNNTIQKSVLIFGLILVSAYIIYLYIVNHVNIYRYVIYLIVLLIMLIIDTVLIKKKKKNNELLPLMMLCIYLAMFTSEIIFILSVIFILLLIGFKLLFIKITQIGSKLKNKNKLYSKDIHIASYLSLSYIAILIVTNFMYYY